MVYLSLQHQNFKKIQMEVELSADAEVELESTFSFNVNYNNDDTGCIAELKQVVRQKTNPDEFNIAVTCRGQFICEGIVCDNTKKEAHVMAYTLLFPYVQNMIARLVVEAGLPPLMLSMAKMDPEDIQLTKNN